MSHGVHLQTGWLLSANQGTQICLALSNCFLDFFEKVLCAAKGDWLCCSWLGLKYVFAPVLKFFYAFTNVIEGAVACLFAWHG